MASVYVASNSKTTTAHAFINQGIYRPQNMLQIVTQRICTQLHKNICVHITYIHTYIHTYINTGHLHGWLQPRRERRYLCEHLVLNNKYIVATSTARGTPRRQSVCKVRPCARSLPWPITIYRRSTGRRLFWDRFCWLQHSRCSVLNNWYCFMGRIQGFWISILKKHVL